MPLNPQQLTQQPTLDGDAKYFDRHLTGKGGKTGLMQDVMDPKWWDPITDPQGPSPDATIQRFDFVEKSSREDGKTTTIKIPVAPITFRMAQAMPKARLWRWDRMVEIDPVPGTPGRWFCTMWPEELIYQETRTKKGEANLRSLDACWIVALACLESEPTERDVDWMGSPISWIGRCQGASGMPGETVCLARTRSPKKWLQDSMVLPDSSIDVALDKVSLAGSVAFESTLWKERLSDMASWLIAGLDPGDSTSVGFLNVLMCRMASYEVSIEDYVSIYSELEARYQPQVLRSIIKDNLSMMLAQTLSNLVAVKPQLQRLPRHAASVALDPRLTAEQASAVTAEGPLVLVSSAAGSGKSSVIKHRLRYMESIGVDMSQVTCLSFTNAAADHLTELAPQVHSMTIAKMIHETYSLNHPTHQLAESRTLDNSLHVWFPHDTVATDVGKLARDVSRTPSARNWTRLNNYVQDHYDDVMRVLDGVRMTTLELEVVVCYQRIDQMSEPAGISSKYLVLDEVQDNSLFEFVYVLKYVTKHRESLYIVGDPSQTLYEFRNSNPEVLNALLRTGTFENHNLQINFRSNQAILDYANALLAGIHANEAANLRLSSNDLSPVTKDDFTDRVRIIAKRVRTKTEWNQTGLTDALWSREAQAFLRDANASGRQVAMLTRTRFMANTMETQVSKMFPSAKVANLCPARNYDFDTFSAFCAKRFDEVAFSQIPLSDVRTCMLADLDYLVRGKASDHYAEVKSALDDWFMRTLSAYKGWQSMEASGRITHDELLDLIKASLISYENHKNAVAQWVVSKRNADRKTAQDVKTADFVISTIHSAKGLEFDDVIIDYSDDARMDEADKRMYYVALTRAKQHELVLVHADTDDPPALARWYDCLDSYPV